MNNKELISRIITFEEDGPDTSSGFTSVSGTGNISVNQVFRYLEDCLVVYRKGTRDVWGDPLENMFEYDEDSKCIRVLRNNQGIALFDIFRNWVDVVIDPVKYNLNLGRHGIRVECIKVGLDTNDPRAVENFMSHYLVSVGSPKKGLYWPLWVEITGPGFVNELPEITTNDETKLVSFNYGKLIIDDNYDFDNPVGIRCRGNFKIEYDVILSYISVEFSDPDKVLGINVQGLECDNLSLHFNNTYNTTYKHSFGKLGLMFDIDNSCIYKSLNLRGILDYDSMDGNIYLKGINGVTSVRGGIKYYGIINSLSGLGVIKRCIKQRNMKYANYDGDVIISK